MSKKDIVFVITQMNLCGAEKMVALLCNELVKHGRNVTLIITHQKKSDSYLGIIHPNVKVIRLEDVLRNEKKHTFMPKVIMMYARIMAK